MNVLFLTMSYFSSVKKNGIYEDLMRVFVRQGHNVFVVAPVEKRNNGKTMIAEHFDGFQLLNVRTGNLQKTSFIKKGIATLRVASQFTHAIKKYFPDTKFDLIMYSTPPITLADTIKYFKRRDNARTFLLLKDIFPQNAIDIGVLSKNGWRGIIYKYFRKKEKKLYVLSDYIGCMSEANVNYILQNNPEINKNKVTVIPNSIEPQDVYMTDTECTGMREKYGIPQNKTVFVYGGNLGKPQDIPFVVECLKSQNDSDKAYFLIVGDGTDYHLLEDYVAHNNPRNVKVMKRLPKEDFDRMLVACDVGMIFLDHRFTIPNYPSRLLSYLQAGLPVLACTDANTDVGKDITDGGFGWWCESDDVFKFSEKVNEICETELDGKAACAHKYLCDYLTVDTVYEKILQTLNGGIV